MSSDWMETTWGDLVTFRKQEICTTGLRLTVATRGAGTRPSSSPVTSTKTKMHAIRANEFVYLRQGAATGVAAVSDHDGRVSVNFPVGTITNLGIPGYLKLLLRWGVTHESFRAMSAGTAQPFLPESRLRVIPVLVPPVEIQQRIVDLLTSADRMVTSLQAELTAVTDVRSQLLLHLVGPSSQGDTGKTVPLGEVSEIQYGKGVPAEERPPTGFRYVTSSGVTGYTSKALVSDDVIVIGRKGSVGVIHLIRGGCWPSDTTFYSKPINDRVGIDFLALTLEASDLVSLGQASAVPGLSRDRLAAVQIPLPSRNEQRRIVDLLMSTSLKVTSTRQRLTSTLQLREQLLHDLLSGGHTIPESYDRLLNGSQP